VKIGNKITLALKYFLGHYRRYTFLILAISFGFAIITVMTSLSEGMYNNVHKAAQQHYGGQLIVLGFHKQYGNLGLIKDDEAVKKAVDALEIKPDRSVKRTLYFADGFLYFAGNSSRQKNVYGIDFDVESEEFASLDYDSGSAEGMGDSNGILISKLVADQLEARQGDDIVLKVRTKTGQFNTGTFIVRGIFRDESLFGYYKCYVDRRQLNELLAFDSDDYSSMGLFYENPEDVNEQSLLLYNQLEKTLPMAPVIGKKEEYSFELDRHWEGIRHFVMTLELFVSQVTELLQAMELISYFLYIMISLIMLVSISVTYKLIIHERTAEIGTMRAMGIQRMDIMGILILEASFVFLISLVAGFLLSAFILWIVSLLPFSFIPGFEVFMSNGRLLPAFTITDILSNILLLVLIIFPALWIPSYRASRLRIASINC